MPRMWQVLIFVIISQVSDLTKCLRSFGRRERLIKHLKSHGIGVMPGLRPQYQQPKKIEFKKEPEFNTGWMIDHDTALKSL